MRYSDEYEYEQKRPAKRASADRPPARTKQTLRAADAKRPPAKRMSASGQPVKRASAQRSTRERPETSARPARQTSMSATRPRPSARPARDVGYRDARPRRRRRTSPMMALACWVLAVGLAFTASYFLREYVFDLVRVNGNAMYETLLNDDLALVSKLDYKDRAPARGDIVAVRVGSGKGVILRRVIAVPGQTVEFTGSETMIDGKPLYEDYISQANYDRFPVKTLPIGYYYVCADNRSDVSDSRNDMIGLVRQEDIVGRVRWVVWPFNHMSSF